MNLSPNGWKLLQHCVYLDENFISIDILKEILTEEKSDNEIDIDKEKEALEGTFIMQEIEDNENLANLYLKKAKYDENKLCNFKTLLKYHENNLKILKTLYEGSHALITKSLNNVGCIYDQLGDAQKRLEYFEQALKMRRDLFRDSHSDVAQSLNNMGYIYGNYKSLVYTL
ncbi:unnamed protein product [Didymodactylos carnosus]|uniref:Kinesin light chain n=1 Tax=Didymodactylos carnosus TaxID=1234261 RepID=A0A815ZH98_9BILA|nr:unnamed protein product [Didymodactylos carnosus]CAF1582464.1 unnamed protein product [Didymodactylos carnosus]CAF4244425.1 unnamed protein product [Didymodactylos carnosus]CAF4450584.1 unnamed protein product [Didymodactylos carnosus]